MTKDQIVCSIVAYNSNIAQLNKAILSFLNTKLFVKLFIIDNSPDSRIENLLTKNPKIRYIFNNANLGYGAAHNIAIKKSIESNIKYHLVLNPDVRFQSGTLEKLIEFMDVNSDVGIVMPEILYPDGKIQYLPKLLPSPLQILKRKTPYVGLYSNYEMRYVSPRQIFEAPIISGSFSLFRTNVLKEVGVYDERFFMYFEDFDISRRINVKYRTVYYPLVSVYHNYERGANREFKLFKIFLKSAILYFNKWGWLIDKERVAINKAALKKIK